MVQQIINIGSSPNKGDGDPIRIAFDKVNDNFAELYTENETMISLAVLKEQVAASTDFADFQSRIALL